MPPDSTHLDEEGVLITNFQLVAQDRFREREMRELLENARYPARNVEQNLADLRAMVAANQKGAVELRRMTGHFGLEVVQAYMQHVQDHAEESVRRVIDVLKDGEFSYEMDNGAVIRVKITIDREARSAVIDFSGTSAQLSDNFNAPAAVTMSAVLYVFRTLVGSDIPLNAGCLKPLKVVIPEGSMLNPGYPAAVVAGNVETSQCVTDTLYGALGVMGASQGTMNNFTFGNERYQYYETICGGSGAGVLTSADGTPQGFDGTDCVHTHMTNTRLTDPEVLEWRFPVLVEEFAIRKGSGGAGRWRGGDGAVRRIRFLEPMTAAILSGHRRIRPYGMAGGEPGMAGRNAVMRANGEIAMLKACDKTEMQAGDIFVIETPGGGGYGAPESGEEVMERSFPLSVLSISRSTRFADGSRPGIGVRLAPIRRETHANDLRASMLNAAYRGRYDVRRSGRLAQGRSLPYQAVAHRRAVFRGRSGRHHDAQYRAAHDGAAGPEHHRRQPRRRERHHRRRSRGEVACPTATRCSWRPRA